MKTLIAAILASLVLTFHAQADNTNMPSPMGMPPGMAGCFGTEQAPVVKVFAVDDNGARFRAYQVRWKDQDVIVSDMFGTTNFKEGDKISFMVNNIEVPVGEKKLKMLQFMIMDATAFAPAPKAHNAKPSQ